MPPSYTIRPYQGHDEMALIDLWNATMTHDRINPAVFRTGAAGPQLHPVACWWLKKRGWWASCCRLPARCRSFCRGSSPSGVGSRPSGSIRPPQGRDRPGVIRGALKRMAAAGRTLVSSHPTRLIILSLAWTWRPTRRRSPFLQALGWQVTLPADLDAGRDDRVPGSTCDQLSVSRRWPKRVSVRPVSAADLPGLMAFIAYHFGWDWVRFAQEYLLELFGPGSDQICFLVACGDQGEDGWLLPAAPRALWSVRGRPAIARARVSGGCCCSAAWQTCWLKASRQPGSCGPARMRLACTRRRGLTRCASSR